MKTFSRLWRRVRRLTLLIQAKALSFILRRQIIITLAQISGEEWTWTLSFQVETIMPGKIVHEEILKCSPSNEQLFLVIKAIEVAEDICRSWYLKKTPVYIKINGDTIIVFVGGKR